ncbi:MAG: hypothetical protein M1838_005511 [Thelocarpon superellum]|nr:MAG: hypothetical protein M1838_005511 [Thelocarpon superellum]
MGSPGTQGTPGLSTLGEGFLQNNILHHWATSMIDGVLALLAKDDARPTLTMELVSLPPEDVPVEEVAVERTQHAEPLASSERDGMAREEDLESRVSEGSLPSLEEIFAEFSARSQSARVEGSMRQEDATVQVPTPILRSVRSEYDQGSGETETNPDLMRDEVVIPPGPPPLVPWESLTSTQCFPDRPDVPTFQDAVVLEAKDMGPSSDALPHRHDESRSSDSEIADPKVELAVLSRSSDDSSFSIDEDGIHRVDVESEAPVTDLPPGAVVWMDADPAAGYPVGRAVSRAELEEFRRQHGMVGTFAEESGDSEEDEDDKLPASQGATPGHHGHEEDRELENAAQGSRGRVRFADDAAHQPEHDGHQQGHEARASAYSALTHRPRQPGPTRANRYEMYFYAVSQPSEAPQPPVQASETSFRQEPPEETTHFVYHVYRTAWKGDAQEEHAKPILQGEYLKPDEATRAAYRELYRLHAATTPDGLGLFDEVNTSREEETGMLTMTGTSDTHGSVMVFVQRVLVADAAAGSAYTAPARVVPKMVYTVWETVTKGPDDGTATVTTTSRDEIYTHLQTANSAAFGVLKRHLRRLYPSGRIPLSQQILQTEATQRAHRLLIKADSQGKCFDANLGIFFDRHNGREAGEVFEEDERCMEARVWVMARPLHGPHN